MQQTGIKKNNIINWFKKIRTAIFNHMQNAKPMGGVGYQIQIDESLFRGKRKYNRGRLLKGNKYPKEKIIDKLLSYTLDAKSNRNYGTRVEGPWVFGMVLQKLTDIEYRKIRKEKYFSAIKSINKAKIKDKRRLNNKEQRIYNKSHKYIYKIADPKQNEICKEIRMFVVKRRDEATLIPIIKKNILTGSEIVSDEWRAYSKIKKNGYKHFTVNHSKNFVDPNSGKHTQLIECLWGIAKNKIMRSMKGTSQANLPGYLAEIWYRSIIPKEPSTVFKNILNLLKN